MLNYRGEVKNLCEIFGQTVHKTPPAGAGECAAPKLLQQAYLQMCIRDRHNNDRLMNMKKSFIGILAATIILSGCGTSQMELTVMCHSASDKANACVNE